MKERLILIPGLGFGSDLFEHQIQHLEEVAEPVVVTVTDEAMDRQVEKIMSAAGEGRFGIVAHSGGTLAAIACAATATEQVSHLVLQGSMGTSLPPIKEFLTGMAHDLEAGKVAESREAIRETALGTGHPHQDELAARVIKAQEQIPVEQFVTQCKFIVRNMDQSESLPRLATKTLFVHARDDKFFDEELTRKIAGAVPESTVALLEDSGHLAAVEQPAAFTALVRLWLTETR